MQHLFLHVLVEALRFVERLMVVQGLPRDHLTGFSS